MCQTPPTLNQTRARAAAPQASGAAPPSGLNSSFSWNAFLSAPFAAALGDGAVTSGGASARRWLVPLVHGFFQQARERTPSAPPDRKLTVSWKCEEDRCMLHDHNTYVPHAFRRSRAGRFCGWRRRLLG